MTRVLIVDDHPAFRAGLRAVLEAAGLEVVAEAVDGDEAIALAAEHVPDVVLMDLQMPGVGGVEATRAILSAAPSTAILVLSMSSPTEAVHAVLKAGARGYLVKDATPAEIVAGIRGVQHGQAVFGAGAAGTVLGRFVNPRGSGPFPMLSEREYEVLDLLARGEDNAAIARALFISVKTARNYVSAVVAKLGVADRGHATVVARDAGLGRAPS